MHLLRDDPECLARGYYSRQRNHRRSKLGSLPPVFRIAWCCTVDLVYLQSTRGPNSTPDSDVLNMVWLPATCCPVSLRPASEVTSAAQVLCSPRPEGLGMEISSLHGCRSQFQLPGNSNSGPAITGTPDLVTAGPATVGPANPQSAIYDPASTSVGDCGYGIGRISLGDFTGVRPRIGSNFVLGQQPPWASTAVGQIGAAVVLS
ncbi:hypothetical protein RHGRI_034075 [Rhododendron griersonianum]|uniref:Uncharacterized protein n=1 Tax=Rhododendron griersonianum TaxID=479676 RepID=A0AAV6I3N0_9ERIC|nr:hypothetical protein RHGRI_034075 [Rhododendron griersonianum]